MMARGVPQKPVAITVAVEPEPVSSHSETISSNDSDDYVLDHFGYKAELKRRFGLWSMIGLSCTIGLTWEGWLTVFNVNLTDGGPAGSIYGFLFCWAGYATVVASLAELVSMIPTAGGQYHWTWELAPARWRKFLSWITGWQIVWAWQTDLAAVFYLCSNILQAIILLNHPEMEFKRWHGTPLLWIFMLFSVGFNTLLAKLLPWIEGSILVVHVLGFFVVLIPLLYFGPHANAHDVFVEYMTLGNYSPGLSWFVGLISTVFAFLGADGAIHMSEEVRKPQTTVPKALMASVGVNGVLGFAFAIGVLFTIGDIELALEPSTGVVFVNYFATALRSQGFATVLSVLFLVLFVFCSVAIMASTSRITWAFARDSGLPGSFWIKKVSWGLPITSVIVSGFISLLLSLINVGSAVAFNAMVSVTVAAFFGSYMIPIAMLFWMRITQQTLRLGPWNLGKFGIFINGAALIWLTITWVFSFFPMAVPVVSESMNWSCALWGGLMILGPLWYLIYQRHRFTGPAIVVEGRSPH